MKALKNADEIEARISRVTNTGEVYVEFSHFMLFNNNSYYLINNRTLERAN